MRSSRATRRCEVERKPQTRRVFLAHSAALGLGLLGLSACRPANPNPRPPQPTPPTPDSSGKKLLEQADFRFVGAFRLPSSVQGKQGEQSEDAAWGRTLALRRVAGEVRVLSLTVKGNLFEVRLPQTLSSSGPWPIAQTVRYWGDLSSNPGGDQKLLDPGPNGETRNGSSVYGLFWDETDERLYWSYGDGYNTVSSADPCLGYSTLEEATGKVSPVGAWRFSEVGCKANMGGVLEIPAWFADKYCAGQRLGAGFGGYFSIATVGPISMGPSLTAFSPPPAHPKGTPEGMVEALEHTPLLGYPFNATPYTAPGRAERDADYHTEFDGWNPRAGVGYWSWSDWLWQGAVWVDTPTRHGLLYFPTLGNGRTWYETSTLHAEHSSHAWYVYDPSDLAQVAQKQLERWQIQATGRWKVSYPGQQGPLPGWADEPRQMVVGSVWDAASSRVYVALRQTFNPDSSGERGAVVYAYEVQG